MSHAKRFASVQGRAPPAAPGWNHQGRPRPSRDASLTVAMLTLRKPSRATTSMAVVTDWCVELASPRIVTGISRDCPATLDRAADSVLGLVFSSVLPLTRY